MQLFLCSTAASKPKRLCAVVDVATKLLSLVDEYPVISQYLCTACKTHLWMTFSGFGRNYPILVPPSSAFSLWSQLPTLWSSMTGLFGVHHGSDGMYWESRESSRDATCLDSSINGVRSSQLLIQGSTISPLHGPPHCSQAANKPLTGRCLLSLSSVLLSTLVTANGLQLIGIELGSLPPS